MEAGAVSVHRTDVKSSYGNDNPMRFVRFAATLVVCWVLVGCSGTFAVVFAQDSRSPGDPDSSVRGRLSSQVALQERRTKANLLRSNNPQGRIIGYRSSAVEGWPVLISERLLDEQPRLTETALTLLAEQFRKVKDVLPPQVVTYLQDVPVWLSPEYEGFRPTGEYHPGADWLRDQRRRPELHRCVELTNIAILTREVQRQPMLILHELAHAWHHQVLGFEHPEVMNAFERAVASGTYNAVKRHDGRMERAYAMANHKEYFAECSEAFFGINDFYPFRREELQEVDPEMVSLLKRLWRVGEN